MSIPLLKTKLFVPPTRAELVPRPRLIEQLDRGLHQDCRLTVVSAPAGYGKTTLLSSWIGHCGREIRAAWVSLSESDNDPASFWAYLIAGLQSVQAGIGQAVETAFESPHLPPSEVGLTGLLNEIAEIPDSVVLVLDDYHVIRAPVIHAALSFLLDNIPSHMHLVLATRADPPLPLPRLRGRGQLLELYGADLRFTSAEATEFLERAVSLNLPAADIAALQSRTEGWITGLQMAAISMRGRDDASEFIQAFAGSNRYVLDYLGDEVLRQQVEDVQQFLIRTAILDRLSAELCKAVVGVGDSSEDSSLADTQAMLEYLERSNLFVISLDDERRWYRYHRLFADLLRRRLGQRQPELVPKLHRRASEWYEENGMPAQAVSHLLAAAEFDRAARLIEDNAWPMLSRGEMTTLLDWFEELPDETASARPQLSVLHAWVLALTGQLSRAEGRLGVIDSERVPGELAALRAYMADIRGDLSRAIAFSHEALESLPEENQFLRGLVTLVLGTGAYWTGGDPLPAIGTLAHAANLSQASGSVPLAVTVTCTLGHVQIMQGQLRLAASTLERGLRIAAGGGKPATLFAGLGHAGMAEILYEWNDLDGAMRHARKGIEMGERGQSVDILQGGYSYIVIAQLYQARGDGERALEALQKAARFALRCNQTHVQALVEAFRAWFSLANGDPRATARWAEGIQPGSVDQPVYPHEFEYITLSRVLIAQGKSAEATKLTARLRRAAEAKGRIGRLIAILTLQSLIYASDGCEEQALSVLQEALSLAEPEGYVRTFIDAGGAMARLLRQALSRGMAPNYVSRLLAAFGEEMKPLPYAMGSLTEPLTEREQEVLRLVAAGLSNPEIAEELFIAISTVKTHVNHINGKLGVKNRIQAAGQARELGLL